MKNKLFPILFLCPITAGLCGASLRAAQLKLSAEGGAISSPTNGLVIICVIALLMALIAAFISKGGITFTSRLRETALPIVSFAGAAFLLVYAAMLLFGLRYEFVATDLVLALFALYSAVSFIVLGKYRLIERDSTAYCIFSAVPAFWAAFLLILTFRDKISDPVISNYIFLILSYISILFFCYGVAAHILGKNRKHVCVFSCFAGIFFIFTELFSLLFAGEFASVTGTKLSELFPLFAFLVIMPLYTTEIVAKKD